MVAGTGSGASAHRSLAQPGDRPAPYRAGADRHRTPTGTPPGAPAGRGTTHAASAALGRRCQQDAPPPRRGRATDGDRPPLRRGHGPTADPLWSWAATWRQVGDAIAPLSLRGWADPATGRPGQSAGGVDAMDRTPFGEIPGRACLSREVPPASAEAIRAAPRWSHTPGRPLAWHLCTFQPWLGMERGWDASFVLVGLPISRGPAGHVPIARLRSPACHGRQAATAPRPPAPAAGIGPSSATATTIRCKGNRSRRGSNRCMQPRAKRSQRSRPGLRVTGKTAKSPRPLAPFPRKWAKRSSWSAFCLRVERPASIDPSGSCGDDLDEPRLPAPHDDAPPGAPPARRPATARGRGVAVVTDGTGMRGEPVPLRGPDMVRDATAPSVPARRPRKRGSRCHGRPRPPHPGGRWPPGARPGIRHPA